MKGGRIKGGAPSSSKHNSWATLNVTTTLHGEAESVVSTFMHRANGNAGPVVVIPGSSRLHARSRFAWNRNSPSRNPRNFRSQQVAT